MAKMVLTDAYVSISSTDLSDHVASVTLDYSADAQDVSAMGDDTHARLGGLKDWRVTIEFLQDYASGEVDATLFSLVGTTAAIEIRPTSAAKGSTNPAFTGTGLIESYQPAAGKVGDAARSNVTISAAGTLSRSTS